MNFQQNGGRGGGRGGGGFRGRGGGGRGRGGFGSGGGFDQGPPETIIPLGYFDYPCQGELVCKVEIEDVPYFNALIYLDNKESVGKIDEIFGNFKDYYVTIKLNENMSATSFKRLTKLYINPEKILPLKRFLPQPPGAPRGGGGRGGRGGRGGDRRGRSFRGSRSFGQGGGTRGFSHGGGGFRGRGTGGFRSRDSGGFSSFGGGFKQY